MNFKSDFEKDLRAGIEGEVRFDPITRKIYSVDASIYEIEPIGVVFPKTKRDLFAIARIAKKHEMALICRGAATGIAGGCIGKGLIIDTSKHLNKILEINFEKEFAICEPGVVQDQLNNALAKKGYRLGPDTSTGNRATIGGMLGNNAAGARSLKYGKMVDHVEEIELILASGEHVFFESQNEKSWMVKLGLKTVEGHIYREIDRIKREFYNDIATGFPSIPRRASGYNLDELIKSPFPNISKLIVGSEGSLGIATWIKLKICKKPKATALCIIHFDEMIRGMQHVPEMLEYHPISLEMIDKQILTLGRASLGLRDQMQWLKGDPEAIFIAEFEGDSTQEAWAKTAYFQEEMQRKNNGYTAVSLMAQDEMDAIWLVRKSGLGLLLSKRTYSRALAFLEDVSVAPDQLASFMQDFLRCLKKHQKQAGIYGHVGSGCMHVRPYIDLRDPQDVQQMTELMEEVSDLLLAYGGALSGEHGDGLVRSWLNPKMFGKRLYQAFIEIKTVFDPQNRMNPGKIIAAQSLVENLRMDPSTKMATIPTFLDFKPEGGFELSVDMCNGNGLCRKKEQLMCPSFQATGDEYDTTRARAQSLRAIVTGRLPIEEWTSQGIYDVLDLCLECKGCKTECPSHVDMAKMKAEFLYQYQEKHGYPLRSRVFSYSGTINQIASYFPSLFNSLIQSRLGLAFLDRMKITSQRPLPLLSKQRFSEWIKKHPSVVSEKQVVLFNDTYTEYHYPEIGKAAVAILEALGFEVIVPQWNCCGKPFISKGLLRQAKNKAKVLIDTLLPYAKKRIPIIGLEPSCILTLIDDYVGLLGGDHVEALLVRQHCFSFDTFLDQLIQQGAFSLPFKPQNCPVLIHGHCHQKALIGTQALIHVLKMVPGFEVSEINSGCCGLAGSFGYEQEHYKISMQIGELHLFPAVRNAGEQTLIVANGMSCRSQIAHGTRQKAWHLAEVLFKALY